MQDQKEKTVDIKTDDQGRIIIDDLDRFVFGNVVFERESEEFGNRKKGLDGVKIKTRFKFEGSGLNHVLDLSTFQKLIRIRAAVAAGKIVDLWPSNREALEAIDPEDRVWNINWIDYLPSSRGSSLSAEERGKRAAASNPAFFAFFGMLLAAGADQDRADRLAKMLAGSGKSPNGFDAVAFLKSNDAK